LRRQTFFSALRRPATGIALILGVLGLPFAASASIDERLGGLTPLVLKDGRIANVTVHAIPFATGAAELDPAAAAAFEAAFRPLATDCFLTAQAIGHVAPGITRDGDTLAAHRLARARADGIQKALAAFGMPEPAVASVWDWQFLVEESQVTLWVFSLNEGDDCDGTPLPIDAPAVATAPPAMPGQAETASERIETPPATEQVAALSDWAVDEQRAVAPETATTQPATDAQAAPRELQLEREDPADEARPLAAVATVPEPSLEDEAEPAAIEPVAEEVAEAEAADPLATAAVAPASVASAATDPAPGSSDPLATSGPETVVATIDEDAVTPDATDDAPALIIAFDVNSSFFPAGAGRQLRGFLDGLPAAAPLAIEVAGAVGTGDVRGASGEEAARYNAWMAERRIQRVTEWLEENAGDRPITLTERLVANDPSREVRLYPKIER
jgi:hypothetical protein